MSDDNNVKFCEEHGKEQNQFWPTVMFLDEECELHLPSLNTRESLLHTTDGGRTYSRKIFLKNYGKEHVLLHAEPTPDSTCKITMSEHLSPGAVGNLEFTYIPDGEAKDGAEILSGFYLQQEVVKPNSTPESEDNMPIKFYLDAEHTLPIGNIQDALAQFGMVGSETIGKFSRKFHLYNNTEHHLLLYVGTDNPAVSVKASQHLRPFGSGFMELEYTGKPPQDEVLFNLTLDPEVVNEESGHLPGLKAEVMTS